MIIKQFQVGQKVALLEWNDKTHRWDKESALGVSLCKVVGINTDGYELEIISSTHYYPKNIPPGNRYNAPLCRIEAIKTK